jgi:Response regulator containing CheY-like receiver, AAA-type ATPase, and DNA-binding domains
VKGKILVVDDEASIRELFSAVFIEADYEVIAAEGGTEALKILQLEDIDVIFLDLKLFGMNELSYAVKSAKQNRFL